ncbi:expressed unknown protein [Seminavis robusta]|uniref:Uncharacterized protein n=1 Tax=Seminavis robusta TaxID=568900 RepID=A0A9N8EGL3_9STRA|nr:expressed unknown protein [Seminavis robusta]|eukprot:Sro915_g219660.1 n/a (164) ;mRNA; r:6670-7161
MTRLEIDYTTTVEEGVVHVCLRELQNLSPLHNLVVTGAPLEIVKHVYQFDPIQMNDDIFLDACRHTASPEVIEFLKELVTPEVYKAEAVAAEMIKILRDDDRFSEDAFSIFFPLFPEASLTFVEECDKTPLSFACQQENIKEATITKLIQSIPSNTTRLYCRG